MTSGVLTKRRKPGKRLAGEEVEPDRILALRDEVRGRIARGELQPPPPLSTLGPFRKRLTNEQEQALIRRVQTYGDIEARNVLVAHNIGLIHLRCKGYRGTSHYEDAIQEGVFGLMRACESYDGSLGHRFSTYAQGWIYSKITRFYQRMDKDEEPRITDGAAIYMQGRDGRRIRRRHKLVRLDTPVNEEEDSTTLGDATADASLVAADVQLAREEGRRRVLAAAERVIDTIKPRNQERAREILRRRQLAEEPDTLEDVGRSFDISKEAIRQIEKVLTDGIAQRLREDAYFDDRAPATPMQKACRKCKETKPSEMFNRNKGKRDGRSPWCRACKNAHQNVRIKALRAENNVHFLRQRRAQAAVKNALDHGKLVKPKVCPLCERVPPPREMQAHHKDYDRRLDVTWSCQKCWARKCFDERKAGRPACPWCSMPVCDKKGGGFGATCGMRCCITKAQRAGGFGTPRMRAHRLIPDETGFVLVEPGVWRYVSGN